MATTMNQVLKEFLANHPGREFDCGGLRLHYIDEGSGEPLVMLHGNPTWSFYYRDILAALSSEYRVIVPDHIGCGRSEKPDDSRYSYTLLSRVLDLERLLEHLGLDRDLTLVMHDWGGMIGMTYAARYPERIARLIVSNTAAFHKPLTKVMPKALAICRSSPLGALLVRGLNAFCHGTAILGCKRQPMPRMVRSAYVSPYDSWDHRIAILRFVQDIPLRIGDRSYELVTWVEDRLHLLRSVPMLLAWGMKDFVFDRYFLDEWVRRFPAAEVHRFPHAGHYLFEDEAASMKDLIRAFLATHPLAREHVA
jgi:haloalkane dehalogenase